MSIRKKTKYQIEKEIIIVLCTVPNDQNAGIQIAKNLLNNKLASCVTLLPNALSLYIWQNKLEQKNEIQLLIKSHLSLEKDIFQHIQKSHPYNTPELLTITATNIEKKYLSWMLSLLIANKK